MKNCWVENHCKKCRMTFYTSHDLTYDDCCTCRNAAHAIKRNVNEKSFNLVIDYIENKVKRASFTANELTIDMDLSITCIRNALRMLTETNRLNKVGRAWCRVHGKNNKIVPLKGD